MRSQNEQGIAEALYFLAALYPRYELTEETIAAYCVILGDLPAELVKAAAKDMGSRSKWFPAAAELREAVFGFIEDREGVPHAYEAWYQICGKYRGQNVEPNTLAVEAMEAIGGRRMLDNATDDEMVSHRARFISAYETLLQRKQRDARMLPAVKQFAGQLNAENEVDKTIKQLLEGKRYE